MIAPSIDERKAALLVQHFGERALLVFAWFFFETEFKDDPDKTVTSVLSIRGTSVLPTIQNACFITTLMATRDIDDFFTTRQTANKLKRQSNITDLKASDLGLQTDLNFLRDDERLRINKELVHSTDRAAYGNLHDAWNIGELTGRCVSQSLQFLDGLQSSLPPVQYDEAIAAARFFADRIREAREYVKKRLARPGLN